jgi:hypothetical protein
MQGFWVAELNQVAKPATATIQKLKNHGHVVDKLEATTLADPNF